MLVIAESFLGPKKIRFQPFPLTNTFSKAVGALTLHTEVPKPRIVTCTGIKKPAMFIASKVAFVKMLVGAKVLKVSLCFDNEERKICFLNLIRVVIH
ncbi:hypothetical protein B0A80_18270 [Flavobacterium tructae]|uniref:Uncharacterized protein n=1 Tax=Flavobacterium tructae TaxID=1114873 RepID=A0A1S1JDV1_9FLAO|nr:hypothetical protein BHE19_20635 [Flavobacterium tructae]OXB14299.1 hypothetical protein B0A71_21915 [Flavobacterium tructae]OXB20734.1 hypothetical protein B0A80_18270 [Flavobacterium tructae]